MESLLTAAVANAQGIGIIAVLVLVLVLVIQWFAWIAGLGRFSNAKARVELQHERELLRRDRPQNLRYLVTEAAVKVINDFRHLLALLFLVLFGCVLAYALWHTNGVAEIKEALLSVTSTIGVVLASIIGYYFGEARGTSGAQPSSVPAAPPPIVAQTPPAKPGATAGGIAQAPAPLTGDEPAADEQDPGDAEDHPGEIDAPAADDDPGDEEDHPGAGS